MKASAYYYWVTLEESGELNVTSFDKYKIDNKGFFDYFILEVISRLTKVVKAYNENKNQNSTTEQSTDCSVEFDVFILSRPVVQSSVFFGDFSTKIKGFERNGSLEKKNPVLFVGAFEIDNIPDNRIHVIDDSSIWHRYVNFLGSIKDQENLDSSFLKTINDFCTYSADRRYNTTVGNEYLELQSRLVENSYIKGERKGHAGFVRPFIFHSESQMAERLKTLIDNQRHDFSNIYWNFLWIDDHAYQWEKGENVPRKLTPLCNSERTPEKLDIIKLQVARALGTDPQRIETWFPKTNDESSLIETLNAEDRENIPLAKRHNEYFSKYSPESDETNSSRIYCVASVKMALAVLKYFSFDVILLDYLLGDNDLKHRDFGSNLLKCLDPAGKKEEEKEYLMKLVKGPLNRYWIFPTTAFSQAMLDEIKAEGHSHFSPVWHLSTGADPINTPNLYAYKLRKFLEMQISEVDFDLGEVLERSFGSKEYRRNNEPDVRASAKDCYPEITRFLGNFHQLHKDKDRGSLFADSMIEKFRKESRAHLLAHVHYLIYLLAYAPAIQWAKMWDEYNIVTALIDKQRSSDEKDINGILKRIRKYIIDISLEV